MIYLKGMNESEKIAYEYLMSKGYSAEKITFNPRLSPDFETNLPKITGQKVIFGIDVSILLWVGLAGALGSIVSIMVRLQDFTLLPNGDPSILFFTGFFKPVVGASFALFVFAALKAGLIPVTIESDKEMYFFMALSFVSGFSERFAKDIATKTEQKIPTT